MEAKTQIELTPTQLTLRDKIRVVIKTMTDRSAEESWSLQDMIALWTMGETVSHLVWALEQEEYDKPDPDEVSQ